MRQECVADTKAIFNAGGIGKEKEGRALDPLKGSCRQDLLPLQQAGGGQMVSPRTRRERCA